MNAREWIIGIFLLSLSAWLLAMNLTVTIVSLGVFGTLELGTAFQLLCGLSLSCLIGGLVLLNWYGLRWWVDHSLNANVTCMMLVDIYYLVSRLFA